jgi:hypothetical protein
LDNDFKQKHPEMQIDKKSYSPDEDKSISNSKSLKPVLADFLNLHPDFKPHTFLVIPLLIPMPLTQCFYKIHISDLIPVALFK